MKGRITFIERKPSDSVSIERVFRQVARDLPGSEFELQFRPVPHGNGIAAILMNLVSFRPNSSDIYHITGDIHYISLRLPGDRTVLTIHDLIFLHRRSGLRRLVLKKLFLDIPLRRCARITAVSQATKDEIIKYSGIDSDRITVIENPINDRIAAGNDHPFNAECPLILHIGTAENKNLENLIAAVRGINCRLRIVGKLDDKILSSLDANGTVFENIHGLDEYKIAEEYQKADIVSFCSTYEGFGLPILEAQATNKPVVTSDLAPMNDVAGKGAALVDPHDTASITQALQRIIDDPVYREELIAAGIENIKRFNGAAIAAKYAGVYRDLLGSSETVQ
jgi:glycosyltransferase involved in cell wall biosynthesis